MENASTKSLSTKSKLIFIYVNLLLYPCFVDGRVTRVLQRRFKLFLLIHSMLTWFQGKMWLLLISGPRPPSVTYMNIDGPIRHVPKHDASEFHVKLVSVV